MKSSDVKYSLVSNRRGCLEYVCVRVRAGGGGGGSKLVRMGSGISVVCGKYMLIPYSDSYFTPEHICLIFVV